MNKVFERYEDQHVRRTLVYVLANDVYAYADPEGDTKIDANTLRDLFLKGIAVVDAEVVYSPVSFSVDEGVATLTYVKTDGTTATTAVLAAIHSEEYEAG